MDWGWVNNIVDIMTLSQYKEEWMKKPGFGARSVEKILTSIETAKTTTLEKFISSLGIPLIGTTVSKDLVKHITTFDDLVLKAQQHYDFSTIDGFADSKTEAIWNFDYSDGKKVYQYLTIEKQPEQNSNNNLNNIKVVITGKLNIYKNRKLLQVDIENHGGKVVGSVSSNTNYLINNDNTSTSAKNMAAKKLNIPILTEEEFIEKFLQ